MGLKLVLLLLGIGTDGLRRIIIFLILQRLRRICLECNSVPDDDSLEPVLLLWFAKGYYLF